MSRRLRSASPRGDSTFVRSTVSTSVQSCGLQTLKRGEGGCLYYFGAKVGEQRATEVACTRNSNFWDSRMELLQLGPADVS